MAETLIGVDNLEPPKWASIDAEVAAASTWRTLAAVPSATGLVIRLAWRTSPWFTALAGLIQVLSGCATAFGLLATANVLTQLLEAGPTPDRVVAALPAIGLLVASFAARGLLDAAAGAVQGGLAPRVRHAAQDALNAAVIGVDLAAFDDPDFRELVRQGGSHAMSSIEVANRVVADLISSLISLIAAMVTAGVLNPWLAPVLLLAAIADGWSAMRVAKLAYDNFLRMVNRRFRLHVVENLMVARDVAVERFALTLQDTLIAEHRRIAGDVTAETVRLEYRKNLVRLVGRTLAGVGTGIAYLVLGTLLYVGGMPLALAGAAVVAMRTASSALSTTMYAVNQLYEHSFYIAFYRRLLSMAHERHHVSTGVTAPENPAVIRLENVSFTYPDAEKPALRDIDLEIHRGEVIALVGQNGSGKTTLGKIITGLYAPAEGRVLWDDVDIAVADPHSVHTRISVISQEPAHWPMTAAHNIRVGRLGRDDPDGHGWARTTILVTHRLANIRHVDRIVVLEDGRITELGTHEELIAGNGLYRELYEIQARAYAR